jgi:ubiquitin-like-conjugating enzyme ATG3
MYFENPLLSLPPSHSLECLSRHGIAAVLRQRRPGAPRSFEEHLRFSGEVRGGGWRAKETNWVDEILRNILELTTGDRCSFACRGVLTPEEFIAAGDMLVFKCPTWTWEAGDPSKTKSYLPKDKQYLMTRGVPCLRRIKSLEDDYVGEEELIEGEDQWVQPRVVSHVGGPTDLDDQEGFGFVGGGGEIEGEVKCQQRVSEMSASVVHNHFDVAAAAESGSTGSAQDGAYPDLDSFVEDNVLGEDDATLVEAPYLKAEEPADDGILQFRRYDLSITYDKYYQTPRMWLLGYGEDGTPLSGENMFEDIMDDYAHQTVTIEAHPHESLHHASIHPCK